MKSKFSHDTVQIIINKDDKDCKAYIIHKNLYHKLLIAKYKHRNKVIQEDMLFINGLLTLLRLFMGWFMKHVLGVEI